MTETGRRTLHFESIDDVMPEVERLHARHTTAGAWSLGQICCHLATTIRRVVDLPASTPRDPALELGEDAKREVLASGRIPSRMVAPPALQPPDEVNEDEEVERLRSAIAYYKASPGPVAPHRFFGPLSKAEWDRLQLIHMAHHLSFVIPREPSPSS